MALTPEFWYQQSKQSTNDALVKKIVRNDILITLQKQGAYPHIIGYCYYTGDDFPAFYNEILDNNSIFNIFNELLEFQRCKERI